MKRSQLLPGARRALSLMLLILLLACFTATCALAESNGIEPADYERYNNEQEDYSTKVLFGVGWKVDDSQSGELWTVKDTLNSHGYYGDANPDMHNEMIDYTDMDAIKRCWQYNAEGYYPTSLGLTYGARDLILYGEIKNLNEGPAPEPDPYPPIHWGEGGDALVHVVSRLYELHYLDNQSADVYNEEVRAALELFGQENGFPDYFERNGAQADIDPRIQAALDSEGVAPRPSEAPIPEPPAPPYFLREVDVFGLVLKMWILWLIGLVVVVLCVIAIIYFFVPSDSKDGSGKGGKDTVKFDIEYNGEVKSIETQIVKTLKIGRKVGNFPINLEDSLISRQHCELYYSNGTLMLRDYSANGTKVNGLPVNNSECILNSGDVIVIGNHTITIHF